MTAATRFLQWCDQHPALHLTPAAILIALAWWFARRALRSDDATQPRRHDWWWGLLLLAILAAGRWPSVIFTRSLNPDESQLLAGAHALTFDPVFWRSVNGGTAGPLDFFALWPAGWLCGWDSYLAARLTAIGLIALSLTLLHQVLSLIAGRPAARFATLIATGFEALTQAADFLHYSTELVPVALLGVAAYAATRRWLMSANPLWNALGGFALGAVPLGKLQPAPLAAVMGLAWVVAEWRAASTERGRRLTYLVLGALLPVTAFAFQLTLAGEWESGMHSYVLFNLHYTGTSDTNLGRAVIAMLGNTLLWDRLLVASLVALVLWMSLLIRVRPTATPAIRATAWLAVGAVALAVVVILLPQRPYLHYWQILLLPGTLLLGVMIAHLLTSSPEAWRRVERRVVFLGAAAVLGTMIGFRAWIPNWFIGGMAYHWHYPRTELSNHVAHWCRPGESLAIWGRADHVYVETGTVQATCDSHVFSLLEPSQLQEYFRQRYLRNLQATRPAVFLDAVGPKDLYYQTPEFLHERNFPELAAIIAADYALVGEFEGARIYRRRELTR